MRRLFVWFDLRFAILLGLMLFALGHAAHGHDHNHPELNAWMQTLKSGKGPCCDGSDALHLSDVEWETTKDG